MSSLFERFSDIPEFIHAAHQPLIEARAGIEAIKSGLDFEAEILRAQSLASEYNRVFCARTDYSNLTLYLNINLTQYKQILGDDNYV